jgi:hypothetical protein
VGEERTCGSQLLSHAVRRTMHDLGEAFLINDHNP